VAASLSVMSGPGTSVAAAQQVGPKVWQPRPMVKMPSIAAMGRKAVSRPSGIEPMAGYAVPSTVWPKAASVVLDLAPASARVPGIPVTMAAAPEKPAASSRGSAAAPAPKVAVTIADHSTASRAGVSAVVLSVARADGGTVAAPARVALDYSGLADAFGGNFADRLKLVSLPACALTTPQVAACRAQTPVAFTNDRANHRLLADVSVPGVTRAPGGHGRAGATVASAIVLAATSGTGGADGDYSATPLKDSDTWSGGGNEGSFTYSYPITVPPALGGSAPAVALSYDSANIDGRTSVSNAQGSWVGDGWGYSPGYIERSYKPCSKAGFPTSSDECWGIPNATISFGGRGGELVKDDTTGAWRIAGDDGSRVELLSGASNGNTGDGGQYWRVTTTDGTQFYFGANRLPGGNGQDPATYSAWGMPVFGPGSPAGARCADPTTADPSACRTGWRWNLDFVVDPHGNLTRYTYAREENFYLHGAALTPTEYQAGGFLARIDYGWQTGDITNAAVHPAANVVFTPAARCISDRSQAGYNALCPTAPVTVSGGIASTGITSANAAAFVDTPFDEHCTAAGTVDGTSGGAACTDYSPTFFNTERLSQITTNVWNGSAYRPVDQYGLPHQFNAVTRGSTDDRPTLWLAGLTHTGWTVNADGTTAVTTDPEVFTHGSFWPNRAKASPYVGSTAYQRLRLDRISDTLGSVVEVTYGLGIPGGASFDCSASAVPKVTANSTLCYPEYWTQPGASTPTLDWFNKYLVTAVRTVDTTAISPDRVANYTFLGTPVWHTDDSEQADAAYRTFDQFRGFSQVQNTTGSGTASDSKTVTTYFRGMDQDGNATYPFQDAAGHVWVSDNHNDVFNPGDPGLRDDNALAGQPVDVQTFAAADSQTVVSEVVSLPVDPASVVTAAHTRLSGLPAQRAHFNEIAKKVTYQQVSTGTRRAEIDYTYDNSLPNFAAGTAGGNGRLILTDDKGDGTVQELCSAVKYASQSGDLERTAISYWHSTLVVPSGGQCAIGTVPSKANLVSAQQTLFDGSATPGIVPGAGDPTSVEKAGDIDASGNVQWITAQATFDGYGRTTSSTDPDNHTARTAYTPNTDQLPTGVQSTNPVGWVTTNAMDQGRQLAEKTTDPNGRVTTMQYDGMGRLKAGWLPDRQGGASPDEKFTYNLVGVPPSVVSGGVPAAAPPNTYVQTEKLREDGSYSESFTEIDGFGDAVQTQATPADGSAGMVVTDQFYNSLGRAFKTFASHWDASGSPAGSWRQYADTAIPDETVSSYDGMSRPLAVTQESLGKPIPGAVTTTAYPGLDRTDVTAPAGNGLATAAGSSTFTDVRGRTTALWTYHDAAGNPIAPDGNTAHADITTYGFTYNPGGSEGTASTVTDATGKNTWTTDVTDLAGHDVTTADPDAGTTTTLSDPAGLVLATADGRGRVLAYTYDDVGRKTGEYDGGTITDRSTLAQVRTTAIANLGKQLAAWTFDSLAKGQPDSSIRYVGGASGSAYVTQTTGYDTDYRPTGSKTVIPAVEGELAGTYQTSMSYSPNTGLLDSTTIPAVGDLRAETVQNTYNVNGLLLTSSGNAHDVTASQYDQSGKLLSRTVGDYPYQVVQQNLYDPATQRVTNTFTDASAGQELLNPSQLNTYGVDDVSYTYDAAGKLTSTADLQNQNIAGAYYPGEPARDNQCYTYDYAGRLTNAWTDAGDQSPAAATDLSKPTAAVGGLGSCASSTRNNPPTAASARAGQLTGTGIGQESSPATYWQSWTFDATGAPGLGNGAQTGNRTTQTDHNPFGDTADDTTATSSFPSAGTTNTAGAATTGGTGPHLLGQVTRTGPDAGTDTYGYDGSGNTTSRKLAAGNHETLTWDAENRLASVTDSCTGTAASYLYDANGNQLIRRDTGGTNAGVILYLGPDEIHLTPGLLGLWNNLSGTRYFPQPGAATMIESSGGTTTYEVTNGQGTGDTVIDAATGWITARRYTTPYGQTRGDATIANALWPDDHTFLGKTTDTSTGLVDIGARKYDPTTGRFISIDPVFQANDPQAIGGYSYAGNNPVNGADPSGLSAKIRYGDGGTTPVVDGQQLHQISPHVWVSDQSKYFLDYYEAWSKAVQGSGDGGIDEATDWRKACLFYANSACQRDSLYTATGTLTGSDEKNNPTKAIDIFAGAPEDATLILKNDGQVFNYSGADEGMAFISGLEMGVKLGEAASGALTALDQAREFSDSRDSCVTHSFAAGTEVRMADGTTELIQDVKVGDEVENAQPGGRVEHHRVDQTHKTLTDKDFTDLTVTTPTGPKTITGTQNHPYYDLTAKAFVNASQLKPGDHLQTDDTESVTVQAVRNYTSSMVTYDLTIDGLHTYYVVAGDTPVLVHNDSGVPDIISNAIQNGTYTPRLNPDGTLDIFQARSGTPPSIARKWGGSQIYDVPGGGNDYRILVNQYGDIGWVSGHNYGKINVYSPPAPSSSEGSAGESGSSCP
jgi:RHS repeat-associated protein